jgi:hypothetical protein
MRNASADEASIVSAGGGGHGIIASSRSSAITVATKTFSAIATASSARSAGATTAAGAPAGRPIGANRARCRDLRRALAGLRPNVRTRPFRESKRLSVRQHQRAPAASAFPRVHIGVQSLQLQIRDREQRRPLDRDRGIAVSTLRQCGAVVGIFRVLVGPSVAPAVDRSCQDSIDLSVFYWCRVRGLNSRPTVYKTAQTTGHVWTGDDNRIVSPQNSL